MGLGEDGDVGIGPKTGEGRIECLSEARGFGY